MASKAKKFLITTVSHEVLIVRASRRPTVRGFCPNCEAEVEMLTLDSAASVSERPGREVVRQIADDEIHSVEAANGRLLVCRNSLQTDLHEQAESE
jgi:hypothetical protein